MATAPVARTVPRPQRATGKARTQLTHQLEGHHLLSRGAKGKEVAQLKALLKQDLAHSPNAADRNLARHLNASSGRFGPKTEAAVRAYQKLHGLTVDGKAGDQVWSALLSKGALQVGPGQSVVHGYHADSFHAAPGTSRPRGQAPIDGRRAAKDDAAANRAQEQRDTQQQRVLSRAEQKDRQLNHGEETVPVARPNDEFI